MIRTSAPGRHQGTTPILAIVSDDIVGQDPKRTIGALGRNAWGRMTSPGRSRTHRALLAATSLALCGCHLFDGGAQEFVIQVDSIAGANSISADSTSVQRLYGPIGPNGCYRFKAARLSRTPNGVDVTALGERIDGMCTQVPMYMDGTPVTLEPPFASPFSMRVHQSDGTILTKPFTLR